MDTDLRNEMDAKLHATHALVDQKLMKQKMEANANIDALRHEVSNMNVEMRVQFAKIDARFDAMQSELKAIQSNFDSRLERGIAHVVKWVVGLVGGAMISFVTVITFVLNHAS